MMSQMSQMSQTSQLLKVPYLLTQHKVMYHLPQPFLSVVPYPAHFLLTPHEMRNEMVRRISGRK